MLKSKPPREKKDSWKKKEAAAAAAAAGGGHVTSHANPTSGPVADGTAKKSSTPPQPPLPPPGLQRWRLPKPQDADYEPAKPPLMVPSNVPGADIACEFFSLTEHPKNRRGFRYIPCTASPLLPLISYLQTEVPPFQPRFAFEDTSAQVHLTRSGTTLTTAKGFRMARANVCAREGNWYYECKIVRGINSPALTAATPPPLTFASQNPPTTASIGGGDAHVRLGFARREAPLDAPVGFDPYSYGLRDVNGEKVHCSRPSTFLSQSLVTGDVIGFQIYLPPLAQQRADLLSALLPSSTTAHAAAVSVLQSGDAIRDRIPIRYKNQLYFEQFEYQPAKELEEYMNPSTSSAPRNPPIAMQQLKGSFIRVYKNGKLVGTPWTDLLAFLPPCSKPNSAVGGRELDDGFVGYYPTVSVYRGGAVEVNFGPEWWYSPDVPQDVDTEMKGTGENEGDSARLPPMRPFSDRYNEQIAEDIVYDLIDEVDCFFTTDLMGLGLAGAAQGTSGAKKGGRKTGGGKSGGVEEGAEADGEGEGEGASPGGGHGHGDAEEIKEMELEEE